MSQAPIVHVNVTSNSNPLTAVLIGASVIVLGYILQRFLFQPYEDLRKRRQELRSRLFMYRRVFVNRGVREDLRDEADRSTREAMTKHEAAYFASPFIRFVSMVPLLRLPSEADLDEVNRNILGLVNSNNEINTLFENDDNFHKVVELLRFKMPKSYRSRA